MATPSLRQTAAAIRQAIEVSQPPNMGGISPLVASYWNQAPGTTPAQGLPRPPSVYTSGPFSPLMPSYPTEIDVPEPDGEILPRRTQGQIGWNLPIGQPGSEGVGKLASFSTLRTLAMKDPITLQCIANRISEICNLDWDVVPTPAAEKAMKGSVVARRDWQGRKSECMSFLERPDRSPESPYANWDELMHVFLEDFFTIDATGLYLHRSQGGPGSGWLGSNLASLDYIDGSCYSADTEVLTRRGWLTFDKVDIATDEFATRNQKTKDFEWQEATYFHEADHDGEMYAFASKSLDLLVTPNHRMLVNSLPRGLGTRGGRHHPGENNEVLVRADDLARTTSHNQKIPAMSYWDAPDIEEFVIPADTSRPGYPAAFAGFSGNNFAAFMGMWLSEGCVTWHGGRGHPKRPTIYVAQRPDSKGYRLFATLLHDLLGRECAHNGDTFYFRHADLAEWLGQFGHARDKFVPDLIKNASRKQLRLFWYYYMLGDGHFSPDGRQTITTSSRRMADDLQEIAQKLGYSASIQISQPKGAVIGDRVILAENCGPRYNIRLRTTKAQTFTATATTWTGTVYCVSVPNEVLYVRRNGKPAWCGNTIRPLYSIRYGSPPPGTPAYQIYAWGIPRVDASQMMEGADVAEVTDYYQGSIPPTELIYTHYWQRAWAPYGMSPVEQGLLPIALGIARLNGQLDFYTDGSSPYAWIIVGGEMSDWGKTQMRQFQAAINATAGDQVWHQRFKVLPPGSKTQDMKPHPLADQFDELLVSYRTQLFGMTPQDLGVAPRVALAQGASGTGGQAGLMRASAQDISARWLNPRAKRIAGIFNRVIRYVFRQPDMLFSWTGLEEPEDLPTKVQLVTAQIVGAPLISIDEGRTELGLEPFGLPETSVPMTMTPQGLIPLSIAMATAQAMLDQAQSFGKPVGGVGTTGSTPDRIGPSGGPSGRRSSGGELSTPGHEAQPASEAPAQRTPLDRDTEARTRKPGRSQKAEQAAELEILARYLRKGRPITEFVGKTISSQALGEAEYMLDVSVDAAVDAAKARCEAEDRAAERTDAIDHWKMQAVPALSVALKRVARLGLADDTVPDVARSRWQITAALNAARKGAFADAGGPDDLPSDVTLPDVSGKVVKGIVKLAASGNLQGAAAAAFEQIEAAYEDGEIAKLGHVAIPYGSRKPHLSERWLVKYFLEGAGGRIRWGYPGDFMKCVGIAEKHLPGGREQALAFCEHLHGEATGRSAGHAPAELALREAEHKSDILSLVAGPSGMEAPAGMPDMPDMPQAGSLLTKVAADEGGDATGAPTRIAAGIVVRAKDTGRVLMLQRGRDEDQPALSGKLEWPGGRLEPGETPRQAAEREFGEEVGVPLPPGDDGGSWTSPNGVYEGHIHLVPDESVIPPRTQPTITNPDLDPDHDPVEAILWADPTELPSNPMLRDECRQSPWHLIGSAEPLGKADAPDVQGQQRRRREEPPPPFLVPLHGPESSAPEWEHDLVIAAYWAAAIRAGLATHGMAGLTAALAGLYADALYVGREVALGHDLAGFEPGHQAITSEATAAAEEATDRIRADTPPVDMATAERASLIAETEAARGMGQGAAEVYSEADVEWYRWLTREDPKVCPTCEANEAGSPYQVEDLPPLPQHPRCRCWTVASEPPT